MHGILFGVRDSYVLLLCSENNSGSKLSILASNVCPLSQQKPIGKALYSDLLEVLGAYHSQLQTYGSITRFIPFVRTPPPPPQSCENLLQQDLLTRTYKRQVAWADPTVSHCLNFCSLEKNVYFFSSGILIKTFSQNPSVNVFIAVKISDPTF